jgi:hypothetical protein
MNNVPPSFASVSYAALLALTTTTAEMLLASGQVIGHRTGRMLKSGPATADDRREFELMSSEKFEAAMASSKSMLSLWMSMCNELAGRMLSAQQDLAAAVSSLASSRTPGEAVARHAGLSNTVTDLSLSPAQFAGDAIQLVGRGLAPYHSTAVANAKRLRRS